MAEIVTPLEFDEERGRPWRVDYCSKCGRYSTGRPECGGDSNEVSSQR
jgi:hypothetical protein